MQIQSKQDQRLIAAIRAQSLREEKLHKVADKDKAKYEKTGDRLVTRLAKIARDLEMCERDLLEMQKLANELTIVEAELGE